MFNVFSDKNNICFIVVFAYNGITLVFFALGNMVDIELKIMVILKVRYWF